MRQHDTRISRNHDLTKAINYMLRRSGAFTRFLDDGRVCLSNNAAERSVRCVTLGLKSWLFCGSDRGGQRAAVFYPLIQTCRLNDAYPQAWLSYVLTRIAEHSLSRIDELLRRTGSPLMLLSPPDPIPPRYSAYAYDRTIGRDSSAHPRQVVRPHAAVTFGAKFASLPVLARDCDVFRTAESIICST